MAPIPGDTTPSATPEETRAERDPLDDKLLAEAQLVRSNACRYCDRETLEKRCPKCNEESVCYLCGSCGTEDCGYVMEREEMEALS